MQLIVSHWLADVYAGFRFYGYIVKY